ncbi:MAG: ABC1 kinase family protein [Candidatus Nanohaloarchaea archaeon]
MVNKEIGLDNFQKFEEEPIAAASIAQVHKAKLKTGQEVVVKIRRPNIKEKIKRDLEIFEYLAERAEKRSEELRKRNIKEIVEQFSKWTKGELNMKKERKNMDIFRENLSNEEKIKIPKSYEELTTEKVLTMEYVSGYTVKNMEKIKESDIEKEEIARTIIRVGLKQVIRDGFFHADPHPSNFFVTEKGKIVMLDFGMVGKLTKNTREKIGLLFVYSWKEDIDNVMNIITELAHINEDANLEELREEVKNKILLMKNSSIEETSISRQLLEIASIASDKGVQMPSSLVIMEKSMATMEGIGLKIYPEFQPGQEFKETVEDILKQSISVKKLKEDLEMNLIANKKTLTNLPNEISNIAEKNQKEVKIRQENNDNQVITSALIISSILTLISSLPKTYSIPISIALLLAAYYSHTTS